MSGQPGVCLDVRRACGGGVISPGGNVAGICVLPDLLADVALSAVSGGAAGGGMLRAGGLRWMYQRKEQPRGGSPGRHDTETRKKSYRKGEFDYEDTKDEKL